MECSGNQMVKVPYERKATEFLESCDRAFSFHQEFTVVCNDGYGKRCRKVAALCFEFAEASSGGWRRLLFLIRLWWVGWPVAAFVVMCNKLLALGWKAEVLTSGNEVLFCRKGVSEMEQNTDKEAAKADTVFDLGCLSDVSAAESSETDRRQCAEVHYQRGDKKFYDINYSLFSGKGEVLIVGNEKQAKRGRKLIAACLDLANDHIPAGWGRYRLAVRFFWGCLRDPLLIAVCHQFVKLGWRAEILTEGNRMVRFRKCSD